jgi:hypothetical protein
MEKLIFYAVGLWAAGACINKGWRAYRDEGHILALPLSILLSPFAAMLGGAVVMAVFKILN